MYYFRDFICLIAVSEFNLLSSNICALKHMIVAYCQSIGVNEETGTLIAIITI